MAKAMPMLGYEDAGAAIDFLRTAFRFQETMRMDGDDGSVAHAELSLDGAVISLSTVWREGGFSTPHELGGVHSQVWCEVDDVDAHYRQARAAGYRTYRAIDPEGHRWYFAGPVAS